MIKFRRNAEYFFQTSMIVYLIWTAALSSNKQLLTLLFAICFCLSNRKFSLSFNHFSGRECVNWFLLFLLIIGEKFRFITFPFFPGNRRRRLKDSSASLGSFARPWKLIYVDMFTFNPKSTINNPHVCANMFFVWCNLSMRVYFLQSDLKFWVIRSARISVPTNSSRH